MRRGCRLPEAKLTNVIDRPADVTHLRSHQKSGRSHDGTTRQANHQGRSSHYQDRPNKGHSQTKSPHEAWGRRRPQNISDSTESYHHTYEGRAEVQISDRVQNIQRREESPKKSSRCQVPSDCAAYRGMGNRSQPTGEIFPNMRTANRNDVSLRLANQANRQRRGKERKRIDQDSHGSS